MELNSLQLLSGLVLTAVLVLAAVALLRQWMKYRLVHRDPEESTGEFVLQNRTKYAEADISRFSRPLLLFGFSLAIAFTLMAFNWTQYDRPVYHPDLTEYIGDEVKVVPATIAPRIAKPPAQIPAIIEEVPDEPVSEAPIFLEAWVPAELAVPSDQPSGEYTLPDPPPIIRHIEDSEEIVDPVSFAEEMPRFPGCEDISGTREEKYKCAEAKLLRYINDNVQYPALAKEIRVSGSVVVRFVVEKDGSIDGVEILRDIGGGCGAEVMRVVNSMNAMPEKWRPGRQGENPVRVYFTLPVRFSVIN